MTPLYPINTRINVTRETHIWFSMKDWRPNQIIPGAVKVGSRWQPAQARIVATDKGCFSHWAEVTVVEERGYGTIKKAFEAARTAIARL